MWRESAEIDQKRLFPTWLENRLWGWLARGAGVALCAAGAAGWLSLLTWSVTDPSLTQETGGATHNVLGPWGAIVSDLMLQMLGLAAVFGLWAPIVWGGELLVAERIRRLWLKACLFPLSVFAMAAGGAALPTIASWPFHHGFGGILGDLIYNLALGLLSTIRSERGSGVAGLLLFAAGTASLALSLGTGSRGVMIGWKRNSNQRWRRRRDGGWLSRRHAVLWQDPSDRLEPVFDVTFGPAHGEVGLAPPWEAPPDQERGEREADFDLSTDLESRAFAQRFAPMLKVE
jgi:S-DNA-T family DNA segregation ATPase FtsK/SpoIIIE